MDLFLGLITIQIREVEIILFQHIQDKEIITMDQIMDPNTSHTIIMPSKITTIHLTTKGAIIRIINQKAFMRVSIIKTWKRIAIKVNMKH